MSPRPLAPALLLSAAAVLAVVVRGVPAPLAADAPPDAFSAARALRHVEAIAREAHPLGTAARERAREQVVAALRGLGVEPEVLRGASAGPSFGVWISARVENVLATLRGTNGTGPAVLLVAHYDSVATGPGAGDDAAGVAALLETLRALRAGPPLRNAVHFLFTDGEEVLLSGARAFVAERRDVLARVGAALNFEARGNRGPAFMFETGPRSGGLVRAWADTAPHPVGSSLAPAVYERMPNSTDFSLLRRAGVPGLNFAFVGNDHAYHSALDTPERLDLGSLQHHGSTALALARRLGSIDLSALPADESLVYFDLAGRRVVVHDGAWAWAQAGLALVLLALAFARSRGVGAWRVALGVVATVSAAAAATVVVAGASRSVLRAFARYSFFVVGGTGADPVFRVAFVCLALAVAAALLACARRRASPAGLALGGLTTWVALLVLACAVLPGASYLLVWPGLAVLGATCALGAPGAGAGAARAAPALASPPRASTGARPAGSPPWHRLAHAAAALPAVVLLAPAVSDLQDAATLTLSAAASPPLALLVALTLPAIGPRLASLARALLALGGALLVAGALGCALDRDPRPASLLYLLDADRRAAAFATTDASSGPWTARYVPPAASSTDPLTPFWPVLAPLPARHAPAPAADLPAPVVTVLADARGEGTRRLRLRLASARGAAALSFLLTSEVDVVSARLDGLDVTGARAPSAARGAYAWGFLHFGVPPEGLELELVVRDRGATHDPIHVHVLDLAYGLGALPGAPVRPPEWIPSTALPWIQDATLVGRRLTLSRLR